MISESPLTLYFPLLVVIVVFVVVALVIKDRPQDMGEDPMRDVAALLARLHIRKAEGLSFEQLRYSCFSS